MAVVTTVAAICGYFALCALFYYGQWQLVLHPSRAVPQTPAADGLRFEPVRFGPDASGQPQLSGWWIPSQMPSDPTVLMLHTGNGTMSDALSQARILHDARLNVLLFDYRGFGQSSGKHPTEASMEQDSDTAWDYLTEFRHVPAPGIVVYGSGVGASLAVRLCDEHRNAAALILERADGDFTSRVERDSRSRMVPINLLFNEPFPLADRLHTLRTPKLLVSWKEAAAPPVDFARAADPKMTVELAAGDYSAMQQSLRRFLDAYVTHPPAEIIPQH